MKKIIYSLSMFLVCCLILPASELRSDFRSHAEPGWRDIDLSISYPDKWAAVSGVRTNTPIKFVSDRGGIAVFTITIRDIPPGASAKDITSMFEDKEFLKSLVVKGEIVAESKVIDIDGNESLYTLSMVTREKATETKRTLNWKYFCPYQNKIILFGGTLNTPPEVSQEWAVTAANHYGQIFTRMVDSIVIHSRWKP